MRRHTNPLGTGCDRIRIPWTAMAVRDERHARQQSAAHRHHQPSPSRRFHGRHRAVCCRVVVGGEATAAQQDHAANSRQRPDGCSHRCDRGRETGSTAALPRYVLPLVRPPCATNHRLPQDSGVPVRGQHQM
ncbi:hypothetical protein XAR_3923 [Xanthomonas citri pv. glycines str. 8ra]|nr:hypothetical protein XAR_3923 [Xanthomonas citri pv. glycines str. 8ra]